jgi:hypothetical protein
MRLYRRKTEPTILGLMLIALMGGMLGGCSDIYYDRRDPISLASGDAINANKVVQMVDPWPASSVKRTIAYDGVRAQTAVARYRAGRVIPPVNATTSSVSYQQAQQAANSSAASAPSAGGGSWGPPPTPSVK